MSRKLVFLLVVALAAVLTAWLNARGFLDLATVQAELGRLQALADARPVAFSLLYAGVYVGITALSVPAAATLLTLSAGAIFGILHGVVLVSFASSIGATLACALSRFLFRDAVERRFGTAARAVNRGLAREGPYYLFALRLVPLFPFFVINLVMGLTRLPLKTFYGVSQLGMLPGTLVYVNAGTQLARIESLGDVASPAVLGSFALLGIFPLLARRVVERFTARRRLAAWPRPRRFDANLVVIGAGAAGLVTAYVAAAAKARVILIEEAEMGGDCLNRGCVPSKALIRSSRIASYLRRAPEFGLAPSRDLFAPGVDFGRVMARVREVIARIEPHDSVERYTALGVECVKGRAQLRSPWAVEVNGRVITTRSIVLATGGQPALPPIPGLDRVAALTSDTVWGLEELPRRLLVLGGGPIGCELAQAFHRLGSAVTLLEAADRLLNREAPEVSRRLAAQFESEGMGVLTACRALEFQPVGTGGLLRYRGPEGEAELTFDRVLVATGRRARTAGLGLEELGIARNADGTVATNEYLQTTLPHIYACGDVAGPFQLTHAAAHQAWYCAMNALYGDFWRFRANYAVIPAAIFTDPEVARVGLTEAEARDQGLDVETVTYDMGELDRAIADGEARGFVQVVTPCRSDRILGVTVLGPHAGDIISEFVLAMRHGLGLRKVLGTLHIYPTLAEANRHAAGEWQKRHLPARLLRLAGWFNRRRRGADQDQNQL